MTAFTGVDTATLEAWLGEAQRAYHQLSIGQVARTYVDQNGERVEFTVTNKEKLRAYIYELKAALGQPVGHPGPMRPWML